MELWTDIKWVRFGPTELSISGSDAEFWDLSFEKGSRLPGSHLDRKNWKTVWKTTFFKFLTVVCHQVGRIKVLWALVKCIRRRILRSFICNGSQGPVLSNTYHFYQKTFNCWDLLGVKNRGKSEMFDEMGQNSSKFGTFDTNRRAPGVGPQKCWFWQILPNFLGVKSILLFVGSFLAPRIPRLGAY